MNIQSSGANKITSNLCGPFYKYPKIAINILKYVHKRGFNCMPTKNEDNKGLTKKENS